MKKNVSRLRLSPNEEAQLIREDYERRRKLRIQQVREQARVVALQIRTDVQRRRERELQNLAEELKEDWEHQQREKITILQKLYQESLQLTGQAHRSAKENQPDWDALAQREEENHTKAETRYREALKELKSQKERDDEAQNRPINARKKALQAERERSAKVASLPPPPPHPIENIDAKQQFQHGVRSDVMVFSATHHHRPEPTVDRELPATQPDAHMVAEEESRRLQELQTEAARQREEQLEKARLRGKHALRRQRLTQDRERFLVQLEHMQQTDMLRRRQQVSQMPAQIFHPLHKREELREDCQREMEFAFEDMYTGERRVKGDLVLQLVPEPLPVPSTGSQDQELDLTVDDDEDTPLEVTPETVQGHRHNGQQTEAATVRVEPTRPAPRQTLRKLLDRIRSQKDQGANRGGNHVAKRLAAVPEEAPERDTSIDTGSLSSEEQGRTPAAFPERSEGPPALESSGEESVLAGAPVVPEVLASRVQEFEQERKRREEELDREKQQQIALLQELEQQKARLEQMLLEAQQERESLKSAVTQEVPVRRDQEVNNVCPTAAAPELEERQDVHSRRLREYQQRLLEQNRIHKRSVEVARQRLEEYQRALRLRYNMAATHAPPTAAPTANIHTPPLSVKTVVPIATPLQLPVGSAVPTCFPRAQAKAPAPAPAPVETPTREPDVWAPNLILSGRSLLPRTRLVTDSSSLPLQLEATADDPLHQRAGVTAWLTKSIMERVTEHLPDRLRPTSVTPNRFVRRPLEAEATADHINQTCIPVAPASGPIRIVSLNRTDGPASLPGQASAKPLTSHPGHPQQGPVTPGEGDLERQRQELRETHRWMLEQREAMARHRDEEGRRLEEQRCQREAEREQMRRQREALQALINADAQPAPEPEPEGEVLVAEDLGESRLRLLSSLLRAIEESHGGTLSHLQDDQGQDDAQLQRCTPPASGSPAVVQPPSQRTGPPQAPRAQNPPVNRIKLGAMAMMPGQHELSAIQEVETPVNSSLVAELEDGVGMQPHPETRPLHALHPVISNRLLCGASQTQIEERSALSGSLSGSEPSAELSWGERLLVEAGSSSETSGTEPGPARLSWPLSDRGARESPGSSFTSGYTTTNESVRRPAYPDSLYSTTLSTGSYVTTDPEHNNAHADASQLHAGAGVERVEGRATGAGCLAPASPQSSSSSFSVGRSAVSPSGPAASPGRALDSLFHDGSIQRIIDKYTRELNASLSTEGLSADTNQPTGSIQERSGQRQAVSPEAEGAPQRRGMAWDNSVNQVLERFSEQLLLVQDPGQDTSFKPLIGQLAEQSSCLEAEQRDSAVERLIGQPSAHSSMIGQLPGPSIRMGANQGVWDSTLSRMTGRLSHQSSSHWLSGGQDLNAKRLIGQKASEQSSAWFDEVREESQMRPLVGQLDESSIQGRGGSGAGSSGESSSVDPGGASQTAGAPLPVPVLEDQPPDSPDPGPDPRGASSGRLSPHQSSSHWLGGAQDLRASSLIGQLEQSSAWLCGGQEESRMMPLVGQMDESAVQGRGSSGESSSVDPGGASQTAGAPHPVPVLEDQPPDSPDPGPDPRGASGGRLSPHQSSSHWLGGAQDLRASSLIGQLEQSSAWLCGGQEESRMMPLVGQMDESAVQGRGSSGESSSVDPGGASQAAGAPHPVLVLEDQPPDSPDPGPDPRGASGGRLSPNQSSSHWLRGAQDLRASSLIGQLEQSSAWLCGDQEESRMMPLVGQMDESTAQGSSGYGSCRTYETRLNQECGVARAASGETDYAPPRSSGVDPGGAAQVASAAAPGPVSVVASRPYGSSGPGLQGWGQHLQDTSSPLHRDPEDTGGPDSFRPLLAEVTHNDTLECSLTFHLPEQEVPSSPEGSRQSTGNPLLSPHPNGSMSEGRGNLARHEEDSPVQSDPSPEHLRTEEPYACLTPASPPLHSFCQLAISHNQSDLLVSSAGQEVALAAPPLGESLTSEPQQPKTNAQLGLTLKSSAPIWDKIMEAAGEKGILEQSDITLVSVNNSCLEDHEASVGREHALEEEELESTTEVNPTSIQGKRPESDADMLLEFQRSSSRRLQEAFQKKRQALLERSAFRVEEIKAKRALAKTQPQSQARPQQNQARKEVLQPSQSKARLQPSQAQAKSQPCQSNAGSLVDWVGPEEHTRSKDQGPQPVCIKAKKKTKQPGTKGGMVPVKTTPVTASSQSLKPKQPCPASDLRLKEEVEVRLCTPGQRKLNASEMHQRTQRLYSRLEEVQQQKETRSRQECYAHNRLKAKEFHKKTLQKLRAKQTAQ